MKAYPNYVIAYEITASLSIVPMLANGGLHLLLDSDELLVIRQKIHQQRAQINIVANACQEITFEQIGGGKDISHLPVVARSWAMPLSILCRKP